jgi:LysM repeat protein
MKIQTRLFFVFFFFSSLGIVAQAQKKYEPYLTYFKQYNAMAIKQMDKHKIPASIILAQGVLESGAGLSSLAKESNNHFGIKCHNDWNGKRVYKTDDRPNECFRGYDAVGDSYEDHSKFLCQHQRYSFLFDYDIRDYTAWAKGLQTSGYATDKAYANKLIKIIEDYELYKYDSKKKIKTKREKGKNKPVVPLKMRATYIWGGLIYIEAEENDSFDKIADDMGFKVKKLLKYNEVPEDFPLKKGAVVYLEKKKKKADLPHFEHVVKIGESMHSISQKYGIQLKSLYKFNKKDTEYVPAEGDVLRLR